MLKKAVQPAKAIKMRGKKMGQALILVGHGAGEEALVFYRMLAEDIRREYSYTWLAMLHGEPTAEEAAKEASEAGVKKALILPLLLAPGLHLSKNIAAEDSEIRRAFSQAGIETEVINEGLLQAPPMREAVAAHCLKAIGKSTDFKD
ncbi:MAG: hypothetical protein GX222_04770 [Ruminococcaceae bacterium]|nr:hypothetical protein [Oscillospiraceae bacterium]